MPTSRDARAGKVEFHVFLPVDDWERLAKLARTTGETMSTLARRALRQLFVAERAAEGQSAR